jgi:predicted regulator of Ras-like GTPase activity (Roadblock/LC7/MglB family)
MPAAGRRDGWAFGEQDFNSIADSMRRFVAGSGSRCALLVDRSGQLVTTAGEDPGFDTTSFASLTAADFSANDQLARLLGESDFTSLFHQGEKESLYMAGIVGRLILVALFDGRTTQGMVKLRTKETVEEIAGICERMQVAAGDSQSAPGILAGAEDEIDQLFR